MFLMRIRRVTSLVLSAVYCLSLYACDGLDQKKFDQVYRAGKALQVEIESTGGSGGRRSDELLKQFKTEISAIYGRTKGAGEEAALRSFKEASDAYEHFLRFRFLDSDSVDGRILLMERNVDMAAIYKLPIEDRGGTKWVKSSIAIQTTHDAAEQRLAAANNLVNGQRP